MGWRRAVPCAVLGPLVPTRGAALCALPRSTVLADNDEFEPLDDDVEELDESELDDAELDESELEDPGLEDPELDDPELEDEPSDEVAFEADEAEVDSIQELEDAELEDDEPDASAALLLGDLDDDPDLGDEDDELDGLRDGEFICRSCYMAKRESALADPKRMLCRDCA